MTISANLKIEQGSTFEAKFVITDKYDAVIDLTGYTGSAMMRKHFTSSIAYPFVVSMTSAANGIVSMSMSSTNTSYLDSGRYVYDLELTQTSSNTVSRLVEGIITVTPSVTK